MGKRQGTRRSSKKKEPFFNFNKLRTSLSPQEKDKLIKFFSGFRVVFKELQSNLFKLNQKFDTMEYQVKTFQQNYLKTINDKTQDEEFVLNENDIQELLGSTEKPKNTNQEKDFNFDDYKDNFFDKEDDEDDKKEEQNEPKPEEIKAGNNYSEKLFDFTALVKKNPPTNNHTNVLVPDMANIPPQEVKLPSQSKISEGGWINKN